MVEQIRRFRPFIIAVLVVALIAFLPGRNKTSTVQQGAGTPTSVDTAAPASDASTSPGDVAGGTPTSPGTGGQPVSASNGAPVSASKTAAAATAGAAGKSTATTLAKAANPAAGATAAASNSQYPGYGTPEALQSPKCDRATGKIRIPYTRVPQCVRAWPAGANNGGATYQGVTADKITVALRYPADASNEDAAEFKREAEACASVQKHYELWGRSLDLKYFQASGDDETSERADAIEVSNRFKPFVGLQTGQIARPIFEGDLAGRGSLVFAFVSSYAGDHAKPGYRWEFSPDDRLAAWNVAEWIGKRLATRPAQWAGDPAMKLKPRRYGLVFPDAIPLDVNDFKAQLAKYGIEVATVISYPKELVSQQEHVRLAVSKMVAGGVTSVINFGDIIYNVLFTGQATRDGYNPEWIITGAGNVDTQVAGKLMDQTQWAHAFGIGGIAVPVDGHTHAGSDVYEWQTGHKYEDGAVAGSICSPMWEMLGGIQLAGPNLTPETFKRGMFDFKPNGGKWQNMTTLGNEAHSYGKHLNVPWEDYSGQDDYTEKWWDVSTTGTDEIGLTAPGVYWKLNNGKRYALGEYPTGEPTMFSKDGAVAKYADYPPTDKAPSYPRPS